MKKLILLLQFVLICTVTFGQKTITGKVTENNKKPVYQANVTGKHSLVSTLTDKAGNYKITVPNTEDTLVFSCEKYEGVELPIKGKVVNCKLAKFKFVPPVVVDSITNEEVELAATDDLVESFYISSPENGKRKS